DLEVFPRTESRDRHGNERGEHARERREPELLPRTGDRLAELRVCETETLVHRLGVDQEELACRSERERAPSALDEALADLQLERAYLLRDSRLRQRERRRRARERSQARDLPEREHASWIEHPEIL